MGERDGAGFAWAGHSPPQLSRNYIKLRIREKIRRCGTVLCVINHETHTSSWVNWELDTAIQMGKPIAAMAVKGLPTSCVTRPYPIRNTQVPFYVWAPDRLDSYLAGAVIVRT